MRGGGIFMIFPIYLSHLLDCKLSVCVKWRHCTVLVTSLVEISDSLFLVEGNHLRATEHHLPYGGYGITHHCNVPPTHVNASCLNRSQTVQYSICISWIDGVLSSPWFWIYTKPPFGCICVG